MTPTPARRGRLTRSTSGATSRRRASRYRELAPGAGGTMARRSLGSCQARLGRDAYQAGRPAEAVEHYRQAVDAVGRTGVTGRAWRSPTSARASCAGPGGPRAGPPRVSGRPGAPVSAGRCSGAPGPDARGRGDPEATSRPGVGHGRGRTLLARLEREQGVEGGYWSQESQHFLVRYEGGGGIDVGRSAIDNLERAYESLGRDLGVFPKDRVQAGIYVTKTFAELGGIPLEFAEHVLGFYDFQKLRLRLSASQAGSIAARAPRASRVRASPDPPGHERQCAPVAARGPRPGCPSPAPRRGSSRRTSPWTVGSTRSRTGGSVPSNAVGAAYQLSHVVCEFLAERRGMAGIRALLGRLGQGEPMDLALKEARRRRWRGRPREAGFATPLA